MDEPKLRVLVVDDDRYLVDLIRVVLEATGYIVNTTNNGQEALDRVAEYKPDVILLDIRMPVMDGWTCHRLLKQRDDTRGIPTVVMSADDVGLAVHSDLGVECFLRKPFEIADLLLCVAKNCGLSLR